MQLNPVKVRLDIWNLCSVFFLFVFADVSGQITLGPNNPGTVTTTACSFSYSSGLGYAPVNNVTTSNNVYASVTHCACCDANTNCLTASNFGFAVPAGATITGIRVEIEKRASFGAIIQDNGLRLMKGGVEAGSNLANFGVNWPTSDTYSVYGSCTNLWGTTWTPADINASNFGVYFASIDYTCGGNTQSFIDNIRISVCYTSGLPVELNYFTAEITNGGCRLEWETSSETNNDIFILQRSEDGLNFQTLTEQKATGNSSVPINYSFVDQETQSGTVFYKLLQRDFNGVEKMLDVIPVHDADADAEIITYWSDGQLQLDFFSGSENEWRVSLWSIDGKKMYDQTFYATSGDIRLFVPFKEMGAGIYLLIVTPKTGLPVSKLLIKQE